MAAIEAGADALGLVFYKASPRAVTIAQAKKIVAAIPAFVTTVGLVVDAEAEWVRKVLAEVPIACLQFHGNEEARFCEQFDRPYIKALRMRDETNVNQVAKTYHSAQALLLDTFVENVEGGTGQPFDWDRVPRECEKPLIIAGGLSTENVGQAIERTHPYAVDVSGGVEKQKGIKDHDKIRAFINEVNRVGTG